MVDAVKKLTLVEYREVAERARSETGKLYELIDGELIEKMASFISSRIALVLAAFVLRFVQEHDLGYVTGADGGYIMDDENVPMPDLGYISHTRLSEEPTREVPVPPDLAVEVKSPTDRKRALRAKAEKYLVWGVRMVWLVFPEDKTVVVYTPDADERTLGIDDVLDGGDVLPGFTLALKEIFVSFGPKA